MVVVVVVFLQFDVICILQYVNFVSGCQLRIACAKVVKQIWFRFDVSVRVSVGCPSCVSVDALIIHTQRDLY